MRSFLPTPSHRAASAAKGKGSAGPVRRRRKTGTLYVIRGNLQFVEVVMKNIDHLFKEIELYRTPAEMKEYFESIKEIVNSNKEYRQLARLKKGLVKKFLEEFYPLFCFSQTQYCSPNSQMKIVLGNQRYDAIIKESNGTEIKLEFTCYIDGKSEFLSAQMVNKRGYGDIFFNDTKDLNTRSMDYLNKVLGNIYKKSGKDYTGVNIVFIVDTYWHFEVYCNDSKPFVDLLISNIQKISFRADHIYLMVFNSDIKYISNNIYLIR